MDFLFSPRSYELLKGSCRISGDVKMDASVSGIPAQGFRLSIESSSIRLDASDETGLFYARQTLAEISEGHTDGLVPCCRIEDWPDFPTRGYMLDISRDRVPTMAHLFHLVDCLAKLRYNQLQLYTEHTFAYSKHKTVWADASPMTTEEIRELDQYCRGRHIELVPNQNSFGHMERWLQHDAYKHLAECPEGFRHPISGAWRPQGSVLKPDAQSLKFLDGLYDELLPNFSSRKFNIGGDEPWELGWGASRERVEAEGKHAVYADFLARICELATEHGAEPMCWADVMFEEPACIERLPQSICPILWGYEVDHPFEKQCAILAELGRDFYVAPGDSTWTSYTGRLSTMLANVRAAADIGKRFGASGLLMTHWGDGGHPQPWPVSLPGLVWAGLLSWNIEREEAALERGLSFLTGDADDSYVERLLQSGQLDASLEMPLINRSYLAQVNQLDDADLATFEPKPDPAALRALIAQCKEMLDAMEQMDAGKDEARKLRDELELALRLNLNAASRCLGESMINKDELLDLYKRCWLYRSSPGGLGDSLLKGRLNLLPSGN